MRIHPLLPTAVSVLLLLGCAETPATGASDGVSSPIRASRRVDPDCDPAAAASRFADHVGEAVRVKLAWHDLPDAAAALEVPIGIHDVREAGVSVQLLDIPLREHYLGLWLISGHLRYENRALLLDPCSCERVEES